MVNTYKQECARIYNEYGIKLSGYDENDSQPESVTKELISKAADGDSDAYDEYVMLEKSEMMSRYGNAKAEIQKCVNEFNELLSHEVTKGGETAAQKETRVWLSHPDLYARLAKAQRTVDEMR